MKAARNIFFSWLPLAVAITGVCMLVYLTAQQSYRQSLNDPQIQMAEDGARALASGEVPAAIVPRGAMIDIAQSLAPWIVVYDASGMPLEADATLDGKPPRPPIGIFNDTKNGLPLIVGHHLTVSFPSNENRISWQPNVDVRQAIVVVYVPHTEQFVVAGRNMREVEEREGNVGIVVGLAWLCIMGATLVVRVFAYYLG